MTTTAPSATRPVVVGYVSDCGRTDRKQQIDALLDHARSNDLRLTRILLDARGGWTISELVAVVGKDTADVVLLPTGVHLTEAHERISADLAEQGVRCVVVDDTAPRHDSDGGRPVARLSVGLRRRETVPAPV